MEIGTKEKQQLVITGVLVLVLLLFVGRAVGKYQKFRRIKTTAHVHVPAVSASAPAPALARTPIIPEAERQDIYQYLEDLTVDLGLTRDPFFNQSLVPTDETPELRLKGIAWDASVPRAIINDEVVTEGDVIFGDIRVVKIEEYAVHLLEGEREFSLSIAIK